MDFPFCACNAEIAEEDLQAQFRHKLSMRNGKNRNESGKVIAFLRRWLGGGVNSKLKSWRRGVQLPPWPPKSLNFNTLPIIINLIHRSNILLIDEFRYS